MGQKIVLLGRLLGDDLFDFPETKTPMQKINL
jgi:hypothetical protein